MKKFDVAVVGGGAAGLACASRLAISGKNLKTIVIDAGERLGKKLAASGNGQGNVTNGNMSAEHYFGGNLSLVARLCCAPDNEKTERSLFHCVLTEDEAGRRYPGGRQASALVDSLMFDLKKGNVEVRTAAKVIDIERGYSIALQGGERIAAEYVVFCPGGKAQKQFKTDGSAYALAEKFGHSTTELYPSLVQLKTDVRHIKALKGIRADCRVTALQGGKAIAQKRGDVIFTDYGVSGNAIFALSPYVVDKQDVVLSLEFLPEESARAQDKRESDAYQAIEEDIRRKKALGYPDGELLSGTLHNQLGRAIVKRCGCNDERAIAHMVKHFTLSVTGNLGFDYAQVTKGGVRMDEVTDELESRFAEKFFFAGEVLDVDGECGGYNLHWAFSSGIAVANTILSRRK